MIQIVDNSYRFHHHSPSLSGFKSIKYKYPILLYGTVAKWTKCSSRARDIFTLKGDWSPSAVEDKLIAEHPTAVEYILVKGMKRQIGS